MPPELAAVIDAITPMKRSAKRESPKTRAPKKPSSKRVVRR
jgi:hypothetical protein